MEIDLAKIRQEVNLTDAQLGAAREVFSTSRGSDEAWRDNFQSDLDDHVEMLRNNDLDLRSVIQMIENSSNQHIDLHRAHICEGLRLLETYAQIDDPVKRRHFIEHVANTPFEYLNTAYNALFDSRSKLAIGQWLPMQQEIEICLFDIYKACNLSPKDQARSLEGSSFSGVPYQFLIPDKFIFTRPVQDEHLCERALKVTEHGDSIQSRFPDKKNFSMNLDDTTRIVVYTDTWVGDKLPNCSIILYHNGEIIAERNPGYSSKNELNPEVAKRAFEDVERRLASNEYVETSVQSLARNIKEPQSQSRDVLLHERVRDFIESGKGEYWTEQGEGIHNGPSHYEMELSDIKDTTPNAIINLGEIVVVRATHEGGQYYLSLGDRKTGSGDFREITKIIGDKSIYDLFKKKAEDLLL